MPSLQLQQQLLQQLQLQQHVSALGGGADGGFEGGGSMHSMVGGMLRQIPEGLR